MMTGTQTRRPEGWAGAAGAGLLLLLLTGALLLSGMLWPRSRVFAMRAEQVRPGTPVYLTPADGRSHGFFLVRTDAGVLALSEAATHPRAAPVVWWPAERLFIDPALGCAFAEDGAYVRGPCPRALDRYPVAIEEGHVVVDTANLIPGRPHP